MKIIVNGAERERDCATTLSCLWEEERREREIQSNRGVAIALNGAVVRRDLWGETDVRSGDRVEIVRAISGG